jgi:IclR family KDG regulon transcriptional repressor
LRGFVQQEQETDRYDIGLKSIEIGMSGLRNWNLVDVSVPYIEELTAQLEETSFLAVYNNGEIVYLYKIEDTQSVITNAQLGTRKPVHFGKAIISNFTLKEVDHILSDKGMQKFTEHTVTDRLKFLEELSNVREQGYAKDDEEAEKD